MSGYTKLFSSITDSTIWQAPDPTRLVWITMLAMADQHGYVAASVPGLAARARVELEACVEALEAFKAPDEWSRTKDHDGRRIAVADGGWVLLNHAKYRLIREADDRREQARLAMAKLRAKRKAEGKPLSDVNDVSHGEPQLAQAEASTSTSTAKSKERAGAPSAKRGCRLPPDWVPSDDGARLAHSLGVDWRVELDKFRDYWTAQAGAKAAKLDWDATWRNWVRNAKPTLRSHAPQQATGKTMQALVALEGMKSGNRLADRRDFDGDAETALLGLGATAGRGGFAGDGSGVD